ncbi:MAG: hypothetical protein KC591_07900 [Gemmatimonadetes bacterium]|nr:hypothetical protein [Gemmatimonadota bacterium]
MSHSRARALSTVALAGLVSAGCLGEPPIEDRWTKLEIMSGPSAVAVTEGTPSEIALSARITYRELLTGAVVAEVRASDTLTPADVDFTTDDWLARAQMVDLVLRNSRSLGFVARPSTGFDHLIRDYDLSIEAAGVTPPMPDDVVADTTAVGPTTGLFLLLYFGDVDEVRLSTGEEIEVVTPFFTDEYEILATGIALESGSPTP